MVTSVLCLLYSYSQFTINAADGLKLRSRAARFADTLGSSEAAKVRTEPLVLTRQNVSLIIQLLFLLPTPTLSAGVGMTFGAIICLSVCPQHNDPKVFKLGKENDFGMY